jgi:Xaa-Pro dipeptidase
MAGETSVPSEISLTLLKKTFSGAELVDATGFLNQLRGLKSSQEIEALRLANEVAELGLAAFAKNVVPGKSEAEIAAAVEAVIYAKGVGYKGVTTARSWAHVMSGPRTQNSCRMCLVSTPRIIQEGDLALLELGTLVDGYWSDLTRTRVAGKPDAKQREVHQILLEAQAAAVAMMKPGVLEKDVDRAARQVIEQADYGDYFVHQTGHGVGLRYHEPIPSLHPASKDKLAVGMVSSCEPGIYIPNWGGIRIEDNIAITAAGPVYLSNYDRALS